MVRSVTYGWRTSIEFSRALDWKGIWIEEQSKDTDLQKGTKQAERLKISKPGKNQLGERKEQSADRRVVPRCSVQSHKVTDLEDAEGQDREAMEMTKGRIVE
uniref:Uncharacterized protein n=1 Tax=Solanum tuberosum TaxID=4113 RepID=M1DDD3_SOLTU